MKKVISFVLAFLMISNLISSIAVNKSDYSKITLLDVKRGDVLESFEREGISYESINVNGLLIYLMQYDNGRVIYAYRDNSIVYCYEYSGSELIDQRILEPEVCKIDKTVYNNIVNVLKSNSNYDDKYELSEKIRNASNGSYQLLFQNDAVIILPIRSRSSQEINIPGMTELTTKYPSQNQEYSSTQYFYCPTLSANKSVTVRDSRNNYIPTDTLRVDFSIGVTVAEIAAALLTNQVTVLTYFGVLIVGGQLIQAVTGTHETEAQAFRTRQGFIYDSTYANSYVSAYTEYGYDEYCITNQGYGYDWGEKPIPMKQRYPDTYIGSSAASAYNLALSTYGYWPWGNI